MDPQWFGVAAGVEPTRAAKEEIPIDANFEHRPAYVEDVTTTTTTTAAACKMASSTESSNSSNVLPLVSYSALSDEVPPVALSSTSGSLLLWDEESLSSGNNTCKMESPLNESNLPASASIPDAEVDPEAFSAWDHGKSCHARERSDTDVATWYSPEAIASSPRGRHNLPVTGVVRRMDHDDNDPEQHGYYHKKSAGSFKHMYDKWWTCWAILLVLLVSFIVGINLFVFQEEDKGASASSSIDRSRGRNTVSPTTPYVEIQVAPTVSPSTKPKPIPATLTPVSTTRAPSTVAPVSKTTATAAPVAIVFSRIQALIRALSREPHLLDIPTSWPARAVALLTSVTKANKATFLLDDDQLIQRYALVLLDLSLHNSSMPKITALESEECSWHGITCRGGEVADKDASFRPVTAINWTLFDLRGRIPEDMALLANMTSFDLAHNRIVGSLPQGLYNLTALTHLSLFNNSLTGTISASVGQMPRLINVLLGNNTLSGSIPVEFGSSSHANEGSGKALEWLSLRHNKLSGGLVDFLNAPNLMHLDVGHNNLTGTIPQGWVEGPTSLAGLRYLHLDHNRLTGALPKKWSNLGSGLVNEIALNDNRLTGDVPGRYKNKTALATLHLQNNLFDKLDKDVCELTIAKEGPLGAFRADCSICTCSFNCDCDNKPTR